MCRRWWLWCDFCFRNLSFRRPSRVERGYKYESAGGASGWAAAFDWRKKRCSAASKSEDERRARHAWYVNWTRPPSLSVRLHRHFSRRHGFYLRFSFRHRLPVLSLTSILLSFLHCMSNGLYFIFKIDKTILKFTWIIAKRLKTCWQFLQIR